MSNKTRPLRPSPVSAMTRGSGGGLMICTPLDLVEMNDEEKGAR
jgi:hypothetical protein